MFNNNMDISSANAEAVLVVDKIFPAGIVLENFGTDQSLSMDSVDITETRKGVDGKMVAGFTPVIYPLTITLEASSPSYRSLATLLDAMTANKKIYRCSLVCSLPSIGKRFAWANGVLKSGVPFPTNGKVLDATTWVFHFESMKASQI